MFVDVRVHTSLNWQGACEPTMSLKSAYRQYKNFLAIYVVYY